jgi:hypothetical protein
MDQTKELTEIKTQVSGVQLAANSLNVTSQMEADVATELLHQVKQAEKLLDEKKTNITRPLMKSLATVRDLFKPLELNLQDANKTIKAKILAWTIEEQDKKDKEQARIVTRVERGTMKASTAAGKLEAIAEDAPKSNIRTLKKVRIVDETLIPREWLEPSMIRITEAVLRQGVTIPGIEIYDEKQIIAR